MNYLMTLRYSFLNIFGKYLFWVDGYRHDTYFGVYARFRPSLKRLYFWSIQNPQSTNVLKKKKVTVNRLKLGIKIYTQKSQ